MPKKLKTFEADEETYKIFKSILAKDGLELGDKFNEFMEGQRPVNPGTHDRLL